MGKSKNCMTIFLKLNFWAFLGIVFGIKWIVRGIKWIIDGIMFIYRALSKTKVKKTTKKKTKFKKENKLRFIN